MRAVAIVAFVLMAMPAQAQIPQSRADSLRAELIRSRGFIRGAETQLTKSLEVLDRQTPPPVPVVMDWREGVWGVYAAGFRGTINLASKIAEWAGVVAPIEVNYIGDILEVRLGVPGVAPSGLMTLVHVEGRMIGTITYLGEERQATAYRPELAVVSLEEQGNCTFAQYTDGSWGHSPNTSSCFQALLQAHGPFKMTPRVYVP